MIDLFDTPLTYTDIFLEIQKLKEEVFNLDQDSLIDEVGILRYNIEGTESDKIEHLLFKNYSGEDFTEEETRFLKNIYLLYHVSYILALDFEEIDDYED